MAATSCRVMPSLDWLRSGLHSNGYSLARRVLLEQAKLTVTSRLPELDQPLGEVLLTPTRIYAKQILALVEEFPIKGIAHITGGGITENLATRVSVGCAGAGAAECLVSAADLPGDCAGLGQVDREEMYRVFNMGIGLILVVPESAAQAVIAARHSAGRSRLADRRNRFLDRGGAGGGVCRLSGRLRCEWRCWHPGAAQIFRPSSMRSKQGRFRLRLSPSSATRKTRWHWSGRANTDSPIFSSIRSPLPADRTVVRPTIATLLEVLQQHEVELVLLAGYMKIVTAVLVNAYANRMMNIHPSLLPSFPGLDVQKKAIDWGCKLAGMYGAFCDGRRR